MSERAQQAEFALGSYAHGLTPSKTFNAQQFEDWKRLLAEYRAAIEAEAAHPADSAEALLRLLITVGSDPTIDLKLRRAAKEQAAILRAAPQIDPFTRQPTCPGCGKPWGTIQVGPESVAPYCWHCDRPQTLADAAPQTESDSPQAESDGS